MKSSEHETHTFPQNICLLLRVRCMCLLSYLLKKLLISNIFPPDTLGDIISGPCCVIASWRQKMTEGEKKSLLFSLGREKEH